MSRTSLSLISQTVVAATAISANRLITATGEQANTQGEPVLGVAHYGGAIGEAVAVTAIGIHAVESGAAIAVGDEISCDAQGRAIPKPGTGSPYVIGIALQAAGAAGAFVEVLIK